MIIIFQNRDHQPQMGSLENTTKYLRNKVHHFSTISFRRQTQRNYTLFSYENWAKYKKTISQQPASLMNTDEKILRNVLVDQFNNIYKNYIPWPSWNYLTYTNLFQYLKINWYNLSHHQAKEENYIIISMNIENFW